MGRAFGVGVFGLLLAGAFLAYAIWNRPLPGEDWLVVMGGAAFFGVVGLVGLVVGIVKAISGERGSEESNVPRRSERRTSDPELVEVVATLITVRTPDGKGKKYRIESAKPKDLESAIAKLKAKGCKIVNIETAE